MNPETARDILTFDHERGRLLSLIADSVVGDAQEHPGILPGHVVDDEVGAAVLDAGPRPAHVEVWPLPPDDVVAQGVGVHLAFQEGVRALVDQGVLGGHGDGSSVWERGR